MTRLCIYGLRPSSNDINYAAIAPLASHAIGVDPIQGGTHRMTSDQYFTEHFAARASPFDVIFIDGLHQYAQSFRDIVNAVAALAPGGYIAVHDNLPMTPGMASPNVPDATVPTNNWNGDGYRAICALKRIRTDLDIIVGRFDFGVALIRRRSASAIAIPTSISLANVDARMCMDGTLEWEDLMKVRDRLLDVMEWADVMAWVDSV